MNDEQTIKKEKHMHSPLALVWLFIFCQYLLKRAIQYSLVVKLEITVYM